MGERGRDGSAGRPLVVAIDGPAGAGKSTVARMLARRLGVPYIDTGAMYRAVGLLAARCGLRPPYDGEDEARLGALVGAARIELEPAEGGVRVLLDGEDVTREIRTPEASEMASAVSAVPAVRRALVRIQRRLGLERGGVMEGRDIGTVVFPDATLKVFLTATPEERARRRWRELTARGERVTVEEVRREQARRDLRDATRGDSPLQVARGSVVIDSSRMGPEEVVERILEELRRAAPHVELPG